MTDSVRLEIVDAEARITIDRPEKRNAMTSDMWTAVLRCIKTIERDRQVAAVVLQGVGGSFSAGADLSEISSGDDASVARFRRLGEEAVQALLHLSIPKIALIDGACFGAGCSLALACDVRIASPRSHFAIPALEHGLVYEPAFLQRLVQVVGSGSAALLLLGAARWDASEAARRGLIDICSNDPLHPTKQIVGVVSAAPRAAAATAATLRSGVPFRLPHLSEVHDL